MKFKPLRHKIMEGDLTPMIDMTFQLIAFFLLIINFSTVEKSKEIELPLSELARAPDAPPPYKITLNLQVDGSVLFVDERIDHVDHVNPLLIREIGFARRQGVPIEEILVIVRADQDVQTGLVQKLMGMCRDKKLVSFALRVKERLL